MIIIFMDKADSVWARHHIAAKVSIKGIIYALNVGKQFPVLRITIIVDGRMRHVQSRIAVAHWVKTLAVIHNGRSECKACHGLQSITMRERVGVDVIDWFRQADGDHVVATEESTFGNSLETVFQRDLGLGWVVVFVSIKHGAEEDGAMGLIIIPRCIVKCTDADAADWTDFGKSDSLKVAAMVKRPSANVDDRLRKLDTRQTCT